MPFSNLQIRSLLTTIIIVIVLYPFSSIIFLSKHTIVLHLDNDNAGKSSTDNITHCCDGIYETEDQHPINYKDVNEELINLMKENE